MEAKKDTLERLKNLDEASLRALIDEVARATGMSEGVRRAAMAHTGMIRRRLSTATEEDLNRAMNMVGSEKANEILKKLDP